MLYLEVRVFMSTTPKRCAERRTLISVTRARGKDKIHAYAMYVCEVHVHEVYPHEMHARKIYTHETPAHPLLWWLSGLNCGRLMYRHLSFKTRVFCASCGWSLLPSAHGLFFHLRITSICQGR